jgi:hydroxymethylpyrimidine/phosphomethylpyrimidine kinase
MDRGHAAGVTERLAVALTIAGSDSGGGAGIQADLKTFAALGVYGASVVTALTAQNTRGMQAIHYPPPGMIAAQIEAVLEDFSVAAIKIGMLGTAEIVGTVARALRLPSPTLLPQSPSKDGRLSTPYAGESGPKGLMRAFIIYDPVMIASSGEALSGAGFVESVRRELLPLVDCLTPNLSEAAALLGEPAARTEADLTRQGDALLKLGPRAALMKGGHLDGDEAVDLMVTRQGVRRYAAPRIASRNLHGTGCTLSSAIAANVVLGMALPEAVAAAKTFVGEAIERGREVTLGAGQGPLIQAKLR